MVPAAARTGAAAEARAARERAAAEYRTGHVQRPDLLPPQSTCRTRNAWVLSLPRPTRIYVACGDPDRYSRSLFKQPRLLLRRVDDRIVARGIEPEQIPGLLHVRR